MNWTAAYRAAPTSPVMSAQSTISLYGAAGAEKEPRDNVNLGDDIHQFSAAHVSVAITDDTFTLPRSADTKSPAEVAPPLPGWLTKRKLASRQGNISGGSFTVSIPRTGSPSLPPL